MKILLVLMAAGLLRAQVYVVHDGAEMLKPLAAVLEKNGYHAFVEDQKTFRAHMDAVKPAAVMMYVHEVMDSAVEEYLIRYAMSGGRLIVLHHGMASAKMKNAKWAEFMGVKILPKDAPVNPWGVDIGKFTLVNLAPGHWVTTHDVKWSSTVAYTPSDSPSVEQVLPAVVFPKTEVYYNLQFTDGRKKTVLLGMKAEASGRLVMQDRGGWMMPAGKGWVFYFQPGHYGTDFADPVYSQIILNSLAWK